MAERKSKAKRRALPPAEALDRGIEALLNEPDASLSPANAELSALLRLALELRELPRSGFRAELRLALRPRLESRGLREDVSRVAVGYENRLLGSLGPSWYIG